MAKLREYTMEEEKVSVEEKVTVQERATQEEQRISEAERAHNAQISENYRQIKNAVSDQFGCRTIDMPAQRIHMNTAPVYPTYSYTPAVEQNPQVKEYIRNLRESVYQTSIYETATPAIEQEIAKPVVVNETKKSVQATYSLTTLGKVAVAIFAAVTISMMTLIGVNSNILAQKSMRIDELQTQRQMLIEQNIEVERRIAEARSEETIRQYAESQGMIEVD